MNVLLTLAAHKLRIGKRRKKPKKSPTARAWKILRICRQGKDPQMTAAHPKVIAAAKIVGPDRALAFLLKKQLAGENDIMTRRRRMDGSLCSRNA